MVPCMGKAENPSSDGTWSIPRTQGDSLKWAAPPCAHDLRKKKMPDYRELQAICTDQREEISRLKNERNNYKDQCLEAGRQLEVKQRQVEVALDLRVYRAERKAQLVFCVALFIMSIFGILVQIFWPAATAPILV